MGKKVILALMAVIFVFTSVGISFAVQKGNKRKGKYKYRQVYKLCHKRGEVDSKMPHINPMDKTRAEWKEVFDKKKFEQFGCKEEWSKLSDKDLLDIFTHMYNGASDSPQPAKCK